MAVLRTPLLGGPLLLLLLALLLATPAADAYPKLLVKEKRCASALTAGEVIMGQPVVQGKGQTVTVKRGAVALKSGDPYTPGEKLTVSFPTTYGQFLFEAMGGEFGGGACTGSRIVPDNKGVAEFTAPADGLDVLLWAGYAARKGAVTVTESFLLKGATAGTRAAPIPGMTPPPVFVGTAAKEQVGAHQQGNLRG